MAKRRLWILPLSPWQHELGVWAAGLILHSSELLLTLVKRMGVQTIVFSWKWGVKASLRIVGKPPGDMIRAMRDCEVFQISWFQLRFFKRVDFIGTCHLCFEKIHPALGWAAFHARNRICSTLLKLMKWKSRRFSNKLLFSFFRFVTWVSSHWLQQGECLSAVKEILT